MMVSKWTQGAASNRAWLQKLTWRSALLLIATVLPAHANISAHTHPRSGHQVISLTGRIVEADIETLRSQLAQVKAQGQTVHMNAIRLNSPGGDSEVSIELGRLVREQRLNTFVGPKDRCVSACVYVLLGGVTRMAYGSVLVHRFMYREEDLSESTIRSEIKAATDERRKYIAEMGISPLLADAIETTPNWGLRRLTQKERLHWNIHGTNHADDEILSREAAKRAGIGWQDFNKYYVDNLDRCKRETIQFERLTLECLVSIAKERTAGKGTSKSESRGH